MSITISGLPSVFDRILFTHKGPIVKRPLPLITGNNLIIISETDVSIPSGSFSSSNIGHDLIISGSPNSRNDGKYRIGEVLSSKVLRLEKVNFNIVDVFTTTSALVALANELKTKYELHRVQSGVHGTNDSVNIITSPYSTSLNSAMVLLNDIRTNFIFHINDVSLSPQVHIQVDSANAVFSKECTDLNSAVLLANELRSRFDSHRQDLDYHASSDLKNRILVIKAKVKSGSGPMIGPFIWTLEDPRIGQIADDTSDVDVRVNGIPASVDAVFGLLGAVVLSTKPLPLDTIEIDYDYLINPPTKILSLNTFEFLLNQEGNNGNVGFPGHQYRARSYLVNPDVQSGTVISPFKPKKKQWKYKAYERAYTACLNDPTTLLLNVPSNKLSYPVLRQSVFEQTIRYDPTTLPTTSTDPWVLKGNGTFTLAPGGSELTISDESTQSGVTSQPPFFSKNIDLQFESLTSSAFRVYIDPADLVKDGVFTGVGFGITDGLKAALCGFIETGVNNLSSAITSVNLLKSSFNSHLVQIGVHIPYDSSDAIVLVDATDLNSLIILINNIKVLYNQHLLKGSGNVHQISDVFNTETSPDAIDESTAISLTSSLVSRYESHLSQLGVHYLNDTTNVIGLIKQVGILSNRGFPEFDTSWNSYSHDWTENTTYRFVRETNGNCYIYLSGMANPIVSIDSADLPPASDVDFRIDPMHQVFFGSVGAESSSISKWAFIRVNVNPFDSNQIGDNKSVSYIPNTVPELDISAPWVTMGQAGDEKASSLILTSNSVSAASDSSAASAGIVSGDYHGYLRLEPILSDSTSCAIEFQASISHWTFGLDNKACGLFIDDGFLTTQLVFLQASPTSASVTGTISQPFSITTGDGLLFTVDDGGVESIVFTSPQTTALSISNFINMELGFSFASPITVSSSTFVKLQSGSTGANSRIRILGGTAVTKLGIQPGTYFGRDSNPEPKVTWFGQNFPDQDFPIWTSNGSQSVQLLNRTLRISDTSAFDYKTYGINDPLFTETSITVASDWKMTSRFRVLSFSPGNPVISGTNLRFCGALLNVDEGPSGKNVELQIAVSSGNVPYINILSYNSMNGNLDSMVEYPFGWNDGLAHNYDVYTSKNSNLVLIFADGILLGTFPYSSLNSGLVPHSINFGSGSNPNSNADLRTSRSVVDWSYISVFKDSKLSDPAAASNRYIGIYSGGDPSLLSSYYAHQLDWTLTHTYRLVRDPISSVSLYVDGGQVAVLSINYDSIKLPPYSTSFLAGATNSRPCVAFGSFSPHDVVRSKWNYVDYSLGRLTLTDRRIPSHHVLNQQNVIVSPEHINTKLPHEHVGFSVYSGGTPIDDFLADPNLEAETILLENTPPVPMTQDLDSRGGMVKTITPSSSISAINFINENGYLSSFENDSDLSISNPGSYNQMVSDVISLANELKAKYNAHRIQPGIHPVNDFVNVVVSFNATNEPTVITLLNEMVLKYTGHLTQATIHVNDDNINTISATPASNIYEAVALAELIRAAFSIGDSAIGAPGHINSSNLHLISDGVNYLVTPDSVNLTQSIEILNELKSDFNSHRTLSGVHSPNDTLNVVVVADATNLATAYALAGDIYTNYNTHIANISPVSHITADIANPMPVIGVMTEANVVAFANSARTRFNQHIILSSSHYLVDNYDSVTSPTIDALSVNITCINQMKSVYNTHVASATLHLAVSGAEALVSPDSFDLTSAITLTNEMRTKFNSHIIAVGRHQENDISNSITSAVASNLLTLTDLIQELKQDYWAHLSNFGSHGKDDSTNSLSAPVATNLVTVISLLNEIRAKYELHRVKTDSHKSSDTIHPITALACSDLTTAIQLATDIKNNFNAHVIYGVHPSIDNMSQAVGTASDLATTVSLANSIRSVYESHRVKIINSHHVHGLNDIISVPTVPTPMLQALTLVDDFKSKFGLHRQQSGVHIRNDVWNNFNDSAPYASNPERIINSAAFNYFSKAAMALNGHFNKESSDLSPTKIHDTYDSIDTISDILTADVISAIAQVNSLKTAFNSHRTKVSFHLLKDTLNQVSTSLITNSSTSVAEFAIELKTLFNYHVLKQLSHVTVDSLDLVTSPDPTGDSVSILVPTATLLNEIKSKFNAHRIRETIHVSNDIVNVVTVIDADPLIPQSLYDLAVGLAVNVTDHGTEFGVHGSSVFIRLDPPDRVLYESMKFFTHESGDPGYVSPISDDEY